MPPGKRLLVVSPHFPPSDIADMHRVRMNLGHYRAHGWDPVVLAVTPDAAGRPQDARLAAGLPPDVEIHRVGALPERGLQRIGISAVGLRAYPALAKAGDALLARRRFDLAFFSTTAFPVMALGPRWLRRFGLPYVLDFQDPWFTAPAESLVFRRQGLKHRVMLALHARLEAATAPKAAGLIAVSSRYIEALRAAYLPLREAPAEAIPFGWSSTDLELARAVGRPWDAVVAARRAGRPVALSAGRAGADLATSFRTLLALLETVPADSLLGRLQLFFLGTGYQTRGNPAQIAPLAANRPAGARLVEAPDRLPLLDTLATLEAADMLLILGSDDLAYQPSKLHQYFALPKPIIIVAPRGSRLEVEARDAPGVLLIEAGLPVDAAEAARVAAALDKLIATGSAAFAERALAGVAFEAAALAARECALFDAAMGCAARREAATPVQRAFAHG